MALAILEEREADFRAVPDYVWMLGESCTRLGWLLYSDGRSEEAAEAFRREIASVRLNAQLSPDVDACNRAVLTRIWRSSLRLTPWP